MESLPKHESSESQDIQPKQRWAHTSKVIAVLLIIFLCLISSYVTIGMGISFWNSQWSGEHPGRLDKDHLEFLSNSLNALMTFVGIMTGLVLRFYLVRKRDRGDGGSSSNVFESIATIIRRGP